MRTTPSLCSIRRSVGYRPILTTGILLTAGLLAAVAAADEDAAEDPRLTRQWKVLFQQRAPRPALAGFEAEIRRAQERQLEFSGPGGDRNVIGRYRAVGEFRVGNGSLTAPLEAPAALHLGRAEDFELQALMKADSPGGWFLLLGWNVREGWLISNSTLKRSVSWDVHRGENSRFDGPRLYTDKNFVWRGTQPLHVTVRDQKLSMRVGRAQLIRDLELPDYAEGDLYLGTFDTQYGSMPLQIYSLRVRALNDPQPAEQE